jgi:hypothetical protein
MQSTQVRGWGRRGVAAGRPGGAGSGPAQALAACGARRLALLRRAGALEGHNNRISKAPLG